MTIFYRYYVLHWKILKYIFDKQKKKISPQSIQWQAKFIGNRLKKRTMYLLKLNYISQCPRQYKNTGRTLKFSVSRW